MDLGQPTKTLSSISGGVGDTVKKNAPDRYMIRRCQAFPLGIWASLKKLMMLLPFYFRVERFG